MSLRSRCCLVNFGSVGNLHPTLCSRTKRHFSSGEHKLLLRHFTRVSGMWCRQCQFRQLRHTQINTNDLFFFFFLYRQQNDGCQHELSFSGLWIWGKIRSNLHRWRLQRRREGVSDDRFDFINVLKLIRKKTRDFCSVQFIGCTRLVLNSVR